MNFNNSFEALSAEAVLGCKQKLDEILAVLPTSTALTPADRIRLPKMSKKAKPFVDDIAFLSRNYPDLLSSFINQEQMETNLQFRQQMMDLKSMLLNLARKADNLILLSGSSADEMARVYYKNIKMAATHRLDGAQTMYDLIKVRYKRSKTNELPESTNEDSDNPLPEQKNLTEFLKAK